MRPEKRTPSTNTVRHGWVKGHPFPLSTDIDDRGAEFDRWLSEHDRQVAERAWDRCVGEMPIDPDWKNFYSDQNPYTKEEQS